MKAKREESMLEAFQRLHDAWMKLAWQLIEDFHIEDLVRWLTKRLGGK